MAETPLRTRAPLPCSDEVGKATALEGLQRLEGYVRKHVGKQVGTPLPL